MTNPAQAARVAGLLYLVVIVASSFALYTSMSVVGGDIVNVRANEQLFRLGFASNVIACAAYIGVVALLYSVMKPASATLSFVAAFFGLAGCAISGASMLNAIATLTTLADANYAAAFDPTQVQALARHTLRLGGLGNSLSLVFFGVYCMLLGALILKARFLPKILGVFLVIGGLSWFTSNLLVFVLPAVARPLTMPMMAVSGFAEVAFTLWILVMGVNAAKWREQAAAV